MKKFDRVEGTLEALKTQDAVSLEDALGVFLDLCEDIKSDGRSIENLDVETNEKLLTNLSRSGRIFLKIMKNKAGEIEKVDLNERIKKQEQQIGGQIAELQQKENELNAFQKTLEQSVLIREEQLRKYQLQKEKTDEKRKQLQRLEYDCRELQDEISAMENVTLTDLEVKKKNLSEQKRSLLEEIQDQKDSLAKLCEEVQTLSAEKDVKQTRQLQKKNEELSALQQEVADLDRMIANRADMINQAREDLQDKQGTAAALREKQSRLKGDVVMIQNEIDRLKDHLANSDVAKLQAEHSRLSKEKSKIDQAIAQEQMAIEDEKRSLIESKDTLQAQRDLFEKEKSVILDKNAQMKERLNQLSEQIRSGTNDKSQLEIRLADAEEQQRQLKNWFESLEAGRYKERLSAAESKVRIFKEAQKELFYETETLGMTQGMSNQEANEKREELRSQMHEIEGLLQVYRRKYNIISGLFSD